MQVVAEVQKCRSAEVQEKRSAGLLLRRWEIWLKTATAGLRTIDARVQEQEEEGRRCSGDGAKKVVGPKPVISSRLKGEEE